MNQLRTVSALFDDAQAAALAAQRLRGIGIPETAISVTGGQLGELGKPEQYVKGFWESLGEMLFPPDDAEAYREGIRRGGTLVTVTGLSDVQFDQALDILDAEGTVDLDERAEAWRAAGWAGWSGTDQATSVELRTAAPSTSAATDEVVIPVVEERIKVGKRDTSLGRTRVRSYVTETPVEEGVTLREQHVVVEQRTTDRPATAADLAAQDQTEAEDRTEEVVVGKEARVIGEIVVKARESVRTETVQDTVRKTEVEVDKDGKPD